MQNLDRLFSPQPFSLIKTPLMLYESVSLPRPIILTSTSQNIERVTCPPQYKITSLITVRVNNLSYLFAALFSHSYLVFSVQHNTSAIKDFLSDNVLAPMNDFPAIGYSCFAHRILGSLGGKHCESLQRIVWRGVVSPLKAVSLGIECRTLP